MQATTLQSEYFQLEQVEEGIYVAIVTDGKGAIGNAGIVDLGDRTLVWDTFQLPQAAADLRRMAEELFERPVSTVINSHFHLDHCGGNQVFADCDIYATEKTREMIAERTPRIVEYIRTHPEVLEQAEQQVAAEQDPVERANLEKQVGNMREMGRAVKNGFEVTLPNVIFQDALTFHGSKHTAHLYCFGGGHTPSDTVMVLPEDDVLFIGDLVTNGSHPMIRDGSASEWLEMLAKIKELPVQKIIPGHGPVAGKDLLAVIRRYITHIMNTAQNLVDTGRPIEAIDELPLPDDYADWSIGDLYHRNLKFRYEWIKAQNGNE
ncbi:MAG TPA: MBL fold metallo-hydrolase [Bacilli bacterium]|nr:MBL fold metallo-hydrolase [Bacilli bacterium]